MRAFNDEICSPYLELNGLKLGDCKIDSEDLWSEFDVDEVEEIYITFFGECNVVLSGKVMLLTTINEIRIILKSLTDLQFDDNPDSDFVDLLLDITLQKNQLGQEIVF